MQVKSLIKYVDNQVKVVDAVNSFKWNIKEKNFA